MAADAHGDALPLLGVGCGACQGAGGSALPSSYIGLGDIVSGATAYWGARAYSQATAGNNAMDLIRTSDSATCTGVKTVATGATQGQLDISVGTPCGGSTVTSFCNATTCKVTKLYDQTGNSNDVSQATSANQPTLTLSCLNSQPCIHFTASSTTHLDNTSQSPVSTYPYTCLDAFRPSTVSGGTNFNVGDAFNSGTGGIPCGTSVDATSSKSEVYAKSTSGAFDIIASGSALTVNTFHTQAIVGSNATTRTGYVDGGSATAGSGANLTVTGSNRMSLGYYGQAASGPYDGDLMEFAIWGSVALTAGNVASVNTNETSFW